MRKRTALICALLLCIMQINSYAAGLNKFYEGMIGFDPDVGAAPVRIAVLDTGIDTERLDKARIKDGRSYVSDSTGDAVGHGTAIASLIIGADNGTDSVTDMASNAELIPIVYYTEAADGAVDNGGLEAIIKGIYDALEEHDADIIVISSGVTKHNSELEAAVLHAEEKGVVVISAVGNEGTETKYYPASYQTVIGVGAASRDKLPTAFSQHNDSVMVLAPGENLYGVSIKKNSYFEQVSGTSYACAYVAALCARLKGIHSDMTPVDFRWVLQNSCEDVLEDGYDEYSGFGVINMRNAINDYQKIMQAASLPFLDVRISDPFYDAVSFVNKNGIMNGTAHNLFSPEESLTRAMVVTMLYRAAGTPEVKDAALSFEDVDMNAYYKDAVMWAEKNAIVNGISRTSFAPDVSITREQAVTIIYRFMEHTKSGQLMQQEFDLEAFDDYMSISSYAVLPMRWACANGLISAATGNALAPAAPATRAETANMLFRFISKQ